MCGIFGLVGELNPENFKQAGETMHHRGPDANGEFHFDRVHLGHKRLSIIDLDPRANQPMISEDQNFIIVFNGEIYNYQELKKELPNVTYKTKSDTEVLLNAIRTWGISETVVKLRGMFAFACYNKIENKLFLVRDHVGKKPLFYHLNNSDFYFSSTLNSLSKLIDKKLELNQKSIAHYFIRSYIPSPLTIYSGIFKMEPGSILNIDINNPKIKIEKYWSPVIQHEAVPKSKGQVIEELKPLLVNAVKRRLISDVPLGAFLSGGIDSSLVSAIVTKDLNYNLKTFTVRFEESNYNEADVAKQTSKLLGTEHHEIRCEDVTFDNVLDILNHYGEPFGDHSAIPTYYLSKYSKREITVALSGDGGDEGFAGYNSYLALKYSQYFSDVFKMPGAKLIISKLARLNKKLKWISVSNQKKDGYYAFDPMGDKGLRNHKSIFDDDALEFVDEFEISQWNNSTNRCWFEKAQLIGLKNTLPDALMTKSDVSTMASSLESRAPLLDVDLLEYGLNLDPNYKIKGATTKYILRELLGQYLPKQIINLPKKGFSFPLENFLKSNESRIKELVVETKSYKSSIIDHDYLINYVDQYFRKDAGNKNHIWLILSYCNFLSNTID